MKRTMNNRQLLIKVVDLFLEQSPSAKARSHRIVRRYLHAEKSFSLDSIVWGGEFATLTDVVYYDNVPYLLRLRDTLEGKSSTLSRTYVNYDLRDQLTPDETSWLEMTQELLSFLHRFPFADRGATEIIQTYKRLATALQAMNDHEGGIERWGEETIYHLVLREVTEIVTHIDLELSLQHFGYLIPGTPYSTFSEESNYPNITETLNWAQKAMDAITGKAWLLVTWQITSDQVRFSLH